MESKICRTSLKSSLGNSEIHAGFRKTRTRTITGSETRCYGKVSISIPSNDTCICEVLIFKPIETLEIILDHDNDHIMSDAMIPFSCKKEL